jgi:hypothetical protein
VNNNLTLFADAVCRIHVLINEMLAWERNRIEDKSILHCKSGVAAAPPPDQTQRCILTDYFNNQLQTNVQGNIPARFF